MPAIERIGNCQILEEIASGGMAVVYRAKQESLNRSVAVKALKTSVQSEKQFVTRFEREALSIAQLQHQNIIQVYDFFKERGAYFIVMEYVEGTDLYDLLDRCGRFPIDVAAVIAMQIARALDYAHYRGVIHRDVKPANIMVSKSGSVKLMDFGIARDKSFGDLTEAGTGLGTPSYMSPEQILGDKLDFHTDVFSLGIVLFQMATGQKPFNEDDDNSVMQNIRLKKHPKPKRLNPDIPRELERIIAKCLQKTPRDRYNSTQDLVLALERFLSRRVEMNYNARLVLFLKNQGIISNIEASEYLEPAGQSGLAGLLNPKSGSTRQILKRIAIWQGAIMLFISLFIVLIHAAPIGAVPNGMHGLGPSLSGYLRVVSHPWARVLVDGVLAETTPFASPLELPVGAHEITLEHDLYGQYSEEVMISTGEPEEAIVVRKDFVK